MKNPMLLAVTALVLGLSASANAQCKTLAKQSAVQIQPYDINGKVHTVVLQKGDHAEMSMTFFAGQSYRIMLNSADATEGVYFRVKNSDGAVYFTNASQPDVSYYDFISANTEQLIIEMIVPEGVQNSDEIASTCVSVVVGCKAQ